MTDSSKDIPRQCDYMHSYKIPRSENFSNHYVPEIDKASKYGMRRFLIMTCAKGKHVSVPAY